MKSPMQKFKEALKEAMGIPDEPYRAVELEFPHIAIHIAQDGSIVVNDDSPMTAVEVEAFMLAYRNFTGLPEEEAAQSRTDAV